MSFGVAILAIAVLILVHEAGHFFAARAVGMKPRKFYLGFPPAIVKRTRNGVEYGIGAIPLGGYVKIPGMHRAASGDLRGSLSTDDQAALADELDELDAALERGDEEAARAVLPRLEPRLGKQRMFQELEGSLAPDAYWRQDAWRRVVVIAAGPLVNIAVAIVVFVVVFMVSSASPTRRIDAVESGHPAAAAGLRPGDRILSIAGQAVTPDTIATSIQSTDGRPFRLVVSRHGRRITLGPLSARMDAGAWRIGIELGSVSGPGESLGAATSDAFRLVGETTKDEVSVVGGVFVGHHTRDVQSSIGIVRDTAQAYDTSLQDFFFLVGLISLALALINLLPVLPLDGGHIVMSVIEGIRGRAFSQLAYLRYSAVGMTLVLFLVYFGLRNDLGGS